MARPKPRKEKVTGRRQDGWRHQDQNASEASSSVQCFCHRRPWAKGLSCSLSFRHSATRSKAPYVVCSLQDPMKAAGKRMSDFMYW